MELDHTPAHPSEPVQTGANRFGDWLSIAEAVHYCDNHILTRTAKTLRKWAARSHGDPEKAEISVRREDTDNGYRWMIERVSLDRKIAEELEFEARKTSAPVPTGADLSEPVPAKAAALALSEPGAHPSEPVPTGEHRSDVEADGFIRDQLGEKDRQIAKMHEQLERRDEQIMTMLERDRETNILIKGLQGTLERTLGLEAPKDMQAGDSGHPSAGDDV